MLNGSKAIIVGELIALPQEVAKYIPRNMRFFYAFVQKGTEFEALIERLCEELRGETKWLIEDIKSLKPGKRLDKQFMIAFEICDCLLMVTHKKIDDLSPDSAKIIKLAKAMDKPYIHIKLPLPNLDYQRTGDAIKETRMAGNMTAMELASKINRNSAYITKIEAGEIKPKWKTLVTIAKALNCKPSDFI